MITIKVVLSPALLHLTKVKDTNVVVIDILRATSTICTAIHHGALAVKAVASPAETLNLKSENYLTAAERDGQKLEGFDMGNSPFECMDGRVEGKKIALTTTNGTKCIEAVANAGARNVFAGSFLNLNAMADFLAKDGAPVVMLCAGWKDSFNLEDTLFAGALIEAVSERSETFIDCDAALMAEDLYKIAKSDLVGYLKKSSHYRRLSHLHHEEDMVYCLQHSVFETITGLVETEMKKI
ncbi:MAG: 2-phosphosulfolactate phosphatase [Chitinophagaceae bacterium]